MRVTLLITVLFTLLLYSPLTATQEVSDIEIQVMKAIINAGEQLTPDQQAIFDRWIDPNNVGPVNPEPRRDRSGGPDDFGYRWLDSDEENGPEFEWIDIEDDGDRLQAGDDWNSGRLDLGFAFPYYDEEHEWFRLCSNGWITFSDFNGGNIGLVQMPNQGQPNATIAVNNYDLNPAAGGSVIYWTNEEDMAIASWIEVPRWNNNNVVTTFQIILMGNGRILIQFGEQQNADQVNGERNIGFEDHGGQDGLSIMFHNVGIEEELAIRIGAQSGWVTGTVTNLADDEPISEVLMTLSDGMEAETDEDGVFWLNDVPEDDYTLTASKYGFNSIISDEFHVADQETLEVDFSLPHPEIEVTVDEEGFDFELDPNEQLEEEFDIINDGNGELEFSMYLAIPEEEGRDPQGDVIFDWNVGEQTEDEDLQGVATDGENFYVTGSNEGGTPQVYVFNRLGELVSQYDQPVEEPSETGFRSIVTDGNFLYSADGDDITQFTFNGEFVDIIPGIRDVRPIVHIAYDPESDHFWISHTRNNIFEIDRDGEIISEIEFPESVFGLAWQPSDFDGYHLYVQHRVPEGPSQVVSKIDTETNEIEYVFDFDTGDGDRSVTCTITNDYNPLVWMLVTLVSRRRIERVVGVEMELNTSWVDVDPITGTVDPESDIPISIDFDSEGWAPNMQYELVLVIESNAAGDPIEIPLTMRVTDVGLEPEHFEFIESEIEHTFVIGTTSIRGQAAEWGDEIAAFTQDDMCVGASIWFGRATTITAYGDDPDTDFDEGFDDGEEPIFKVWDSDIEIEFDATLNVLVGDETYTADGSTRGTLTVAGFVREQVFDLPIGWSLISTNLILDHDEIIPIFVGMVERGSLLLLKDGEGRFYAPLADNFINIPAWAEDEGYMIKIAQADMFTLGGEHAAPDAAIQLEAGWNMIAYLPSWELDVRDAFAGLVEGDNLTIVKDGFGHFYVPEFNFSNIGAATPGNGYLVNIAEDVEFHYPGDEPGVARVPMMTELPLEHLASPISTGNNMSLLVRSSGGWDDVELAVLNSNGQICGAGRMVDNIHIGIAVWGDDPTTSEVDGAVDGENLKLAYWHDENGLSELPFAVVSGSAKYLTNSFAAIEIGQFNSAAPNELYLSGSYPNPFNNRSQIRFGLAEAGRVDLTVFDLNGRVVAELASGQLSEGHHSLMFNAEGLASGTYLIQLSTATEKRISKAILLR